MTKIQLQEILTPLGLQRLWTDKFYGQQLRNAKTISEVKSIVQVARKEYDFLNRKTAKIPKEEPWLR